MSDTPETQAKQFLILSSLQSGTEMVVRAEHCAQMEKERDAARAELDAEQEQNRLHQRANSDAADRIVTLQEQLSKITISRDGFKSQLAGEREHGAALQIQVGEVRARNAEQAREIEYAKAAKERARLLGDEAAERLAEAEAALEKAHDGIESALAELEWYVARKKDLASVADDGQDWANKMNADLDILRAALQSALRKEGP